MKYFFSSFDWTNLQNLGALGFLGFIFSDWWHVFFLFYFIQFISLVQKMNEAEKEMEEGQSLKRYIETFLLSQVNPYTVGRSMLQLIGQFVIWIRHITGLPKPSTYYQKGSYHLPFNGKWVVFNGGSTQSNSHSWEILTQRYAYDLVKVDSDGNTHQGAGDQLTDYYCWEAEVLAPEDGEIVQMKNHIDDYTEVGDLSLDWKTKDFRGNFIMIRHHPNEYCFIAHFRKGSIQVTKGDQVAQGQILGKCGNSGHSTEPHIHIHFQDSRIFWLGAGLPIQFSNVAVVRENDEKHITKGFIEKGEVISNRPQTAGHN